MAMTLRLSDEDDAGLAKLAQMHGLSKHAVAVRAIKAAVERDTRMSDVADTADLMLEEWGPVFDALGRA